jgi:hypothetical protein
MMLLNFKKINQAGDTSYNFHDVDAESLFLYEGLTLEVGP